MKNFILKFFNFLKEKKQSEDQIIKEENNSGLVRKSRWGKTLTNKEYTYTIAEDGSWVTFSRGTRPPQRINADHSIWNRVVGIINLLD
jgi:hypothetical protein